jgi:hypothetical protein
VGALVAKKSFHGTDKGKKKRASTMPLADTATIVET